MVALVGLLSPSPSLAINVSPPLRFCYSKRKSFAVMAMSEDPVREWILTEGKASEIKRIRPVGGGCINLANRYDTDVGSFFVKTNRSIGPSMFEGEALGLRLMYETNTIRVPKPFKVGPLLTGGSYIIMEFIEFGASRSGQALLGTKLAEMHKAGKSEKGFGFDVDNTIGSTPQKNTWTSDWVDFYAEHRLGYQLKLARDQYGDSTIYERGQCLAKNLRPLFENVMIEPCLLHGDLWSGNITYDKNGDPVILDPACYYGHSEAEFGMSWCAGFGGAFYNAYFERRRVPRPIGSRPLMLKDFLLLDDSSSCSSSGFQSLPRSPSCNANSPTLLQELHRASTALGPEPKLRRSRSRSAAEVAVSALQKLLNSVKSPASRKKPSTAMEKKDAEIFVQVRVKDILRWRSFRDLIDGLGEEEKALPLDRGSASPNGRSGLDAAAAGLSREREGEKRNVGGEDPRLAGTGTTLCCDDYGGPSKSEHISNNDEEQHSPVSVLDSPFRDDEDSAASFDQSLANVERTKQRLMESIKWLESLAGVNHMDSDKDEITDLSEEPTTEAKPKETKPNLGSRKEPEGNVEIEECVKEMDKEAQWSQFQEQRNQLGTELEMAVLNALLDELLVEDLAAPLTHV